MEVKCCTATLRSTLFPSAHNHAMFVSLWNSQILNGLNLQEREDVKKVIDKIGLLSAKAQDLCKPVTDYERLRLYGSSQRLYICTSLPPTTTSTSSSTMSPFVVVKGILKVGVKNLFIARPNGHMHEMSPLCVLDFYIHHSYQRNGLGRFLFEWMLAQENLDAHQLGYDKPSNKLLCFMEKHYGLKKYFPQANQFVVYDKYFEDPPMNMPCNGGVRCTSNTSIDKLTGRTFLRTRGRSSCLR